jgi:hypothetical protein
MSIAARVELGRLIDFDAAVYARVGMPDADAL